MKKKFWFLVKHSFQKKIRSKWFVGANIVLFLSFLAIMNMDKIITYFGGDFHEQKEIIFKNETKYGELSDSFSKVLESTKSIFGVNYDLKVTPSTKDVSEIEEDLMENENIVLLELFDDEEEYLKAHITSKSTIDSTYYQYIYQALNTLKVNISLASNSIDYLEYQKITSPVSIERTMIDDTVTNQEEAMTTIMGTVFPTIILPFFILVILLVQMIGMEINEEKSSRSMEIIISNVSPKVHFFSKIVAGNAFVFLQAILLVLYGAIALLIRNFMGGGGITGEIGEMIGSIFEVLKSTGILQNMIYILPLTLILLFLSFITYSLVAGILASMTVNMEDFQQIQSPIMIICLTGYYLSVMSGMFQGSVVIRFLSYVPFLSSLLSPALLITNQIHIIDIIISIIILVFFNSFLVKYGLKIYKIGILNYQTDKMWKRIYKATKEK